VANHLHYSNGGCTFGRDELWRWIRFDFGECRSIDEQTALLQK
jgi:hypothetical protein